MKIREKYYDFLDWYENWLCEHPKANDFIEDVKLEITYPFTHLHFLYETKYLPKHRPHYFCTFKDPYHHGRVTKGYYIKDRKGHMIPWVHFITENNTHAMICLYESMITPVGEGA